MKMKSVVLAILMVSILAFAAQAASFTGSVGGVNVTLTQVEANDVNLDTSKTKNVELKDELEVLIVFEADADLQDVQFTAEITGYDKKDADQLRDTTSVFDMRAGESYDEKLKIDLPIKMDPGLIYGLKITLDSRTDRETFTFPFRVDSPNKLVEVRDVILSPNNGVVAGRALLATVRVDNRGDSDEEDVKVTFSIPELKVSASDYIDEITANGDTKDSKSTEELYLRIPSCVKPGVYDGVVEVEYDDGDEVTRQNVDVEVLEDPTCGQVAGPSMGTTPKSVISIGPETQDINKGAGGVLYPVTITNAGGSSVTYAISVMGGDWGTFRVSPSNVVTVGPSETKTVYIYATANANAVPGEQTFGVQIKAGDSSVKEVALKANIVGSAQPDVKRTLEIGLIVLVVILVILGLIIGFNKLKGDDNKEEGQSYY